MAGYNKKPRSGQSSIKYRSNPVKGAFFKLEDFVQEEYAPSLSDDKQINRKSEPKSHKILSTTELISVVGKIWDCANRLAVFHPKANSSDKCAGHKQEILGNFDKEEDSRAPFTLDSKYFCVDIKGAGRVSPMVQSDPEFLKITQKMSVFESSGEKHIHSTFRRFLQGSTKLPIETCNGGALASVGILYDLGNIYRWMTETVPTGHKYADEIPETENRTSGEHFILEDTADCRGGFVSRNTHSPACQLATEDTNSSDLIKSKDPSSFVNSKLVLDTVTTRSLLSDYFLTDVHDLKVDCSISRTPCSNLYADYCINSLASCNSPCETDVDVLLESKRKHPEKFVIEKENVMEFPSPKCEKPRFALAKQEHAFAGALAGIFVSLCLHPVDTIKTVIQSCRAEQKSISYIGRSIVSERGLAGLYRGITSNIASSAPISAVYTFTYESVKGALLPHFPKEFYSLAHCMAGGCSSVATSFIFTPSERIKQQMQVGCHYHNCWNALIGIVKKGGLPSLYAGWGAVLCRNVPHSIIKFYTYESVKQMILPSLNSTPQPNTVQTLICGGLAGSTAALFTTPFDVVKTRLQTQIPGSMSQYNNVYHALQHIGKHEGLRGLYRGLIPRLVMYMSQGALFFGSYEFFKQLFSLEVPQLNAHRIQHKQNKEDDAAASPPSDSAPALAPAQPRLHSLHS